LIFDLKNHLEELPANQKSQNYLPKDAGVTEGASGAASAAFSIAVSSALFYLHASAPIMG
jgi:hypothetical protein